MTLSTTFDRFWLLAEFAPATNPPSPAGFCVQGAGRIIGASNVPWKPKTHRPAGARSEAQRKADFDKRRGTAAERGYDARWRKLRSVVLFEEPLCRTCLVRGYTTPASEVDHIVPHKGRRELFYDRTNLQAMCKSCHSRKTATEDSSFATTSSTARPCPTRPSDGGRG